MNGFDSVENGGCENSLNIHGVSIDHFLRIATHIIQSSVHSIQCLLFCGQFSEIMYHFILFHFLCLFVIHFNRKQRFGKEEERNW